MNVDLSLDFFSLFGLPRQFRIDEEALGRAWRALQAEVHPDRSAHLPGSRGEMQGALRVNEAYSVLKKSTSRAQYLLELAGMSQEAIDGNMVASVYLFEQLELREAMEAARSANDIGALERLAARLQTQAGSLVERLAEQIDDLRDLEKAADTVRRLKFLDKLRFGIDSALASLDN